MHLHHYLGNTVCERVRAEIPTGGRDFVLEYYSTVLLDGLGVHLDLECIRAISRVGIFPGLFFDMRAKRRNLQCGLRLGLANNSRMQPEHDRAEQRGNGSENSYY